MSKKALGSFFCALFLTAGLTGSLQAQAFLDSQGGQSASAGAAYVPQLGLITRPPTDQAPPQIPGVAAQRFTQTPTPDADPEEQSTTSNAASNSAGVVSQSGGDVILNCGNNNNTPCVVPEGVPIWGDF